MEYIKIKDLSFSYPQSDKPALNGINLNIKKGEYVCLCGKSGSGKTTLIKNIKSVLCPVGDKSGSVFIGDRAVDSLSLKEQAEIIGYVGQNPDSQIVTDKVWHELAFGLENLGVAPNKIRLRVAEMASYFGITHWFTKDTQSLSGGQKQICNLAAIMAMNPQILVLDEPTSQLDPISALGFLNIIKRINTDLGTTVIITEHRLEEVIPDASKLGVMDDGRLIYYDKPQIVCKELFGNNHSLAKSMPTSVNIYMETGGDGEVPLTIRDGISYLDSVFSRDKINKKRVEKADNINDNSTILSIKNLSFRYEKKEENILNDLNLDIKNKEIYSILGANGAGKTTLLLAISKNIRPYRGKITYFNGKKDADISFLPQNPQSLFSKNKVIDDLKIAAKNRTDFLEKLIYLCEIEDVLDKHPYDISYGQKQRAALCKVLLKGSKLLLLDEPTKGIDWYYKEKLGDLLKELKKEEITTLIVSHDIEFCGKYSDRLGLLFNGEIISSGCPEEFFCNNSFYTTNANKVSRHLFENAVTKEDVINLCKANM